MESFNSPDTQSSAQEHLTKALNFQRMGMASSAEHELELARQMDPSIVADSRYQSFNVKLVEEKKQAEAWKLPMRVGAGILIGDVVLTAILLLLNFAIGNGSRFLLSSFVHFLVDLYLIVNLLRLKDTARRTTIWWAALGLILGIYISLSSGSWLDMVMQVCFSGSLLLLLLGKPSSLRAGIALAVYVLGDYVLFFAVIGYSFFRALG